MNRVSDEEIEKVVRSLKERDGVCSPKAFVDEARSEESPIHGLFDWDEHANSERWLEHRARQIIGRVKIIADEVPTPAFVHVTIIEEESRCEGYVPVEEAVANDDMRAQMFKEAIAGLNGWRNRFASLQRFQRAKSAIGLVDQAIETLKKDGEDEG